MLWGVRKTESKESVYGGLKPHLVVSLCSGCRFPLRVARFAELPRVLKRGRALQISASRSAGFRFFAFDGLVPVASRQFPVVFRQFRSGRDPSVSGRVPSVSVVFRQFPVVFRQFPVVIRQFRSCSISFQSCSVKRRQGDVPWDAMHRTLKL